MSARATRTISLATVKERRVVGAEIGFVLVQDVLVCGMKYVSWGGGRKDDSFVPEISKT